MMHTVRIMLFAMCVAAAGVCQVQAEENSPSRQNASDAAGNVIVSGSDVARPAAPDYPSKQDLKLLKQALTVTGHTSIASIALIHKLYPEATANVKAALEVARSLESATEKFSSREAIRFGRLHYRSPYGEQDIWLPLLGDSFAVRTLNGTFTKSRHAEASVTDAQMTNILLVLNTTVIRAELEKAEAAMKQKEYHAAWLALERAQEFTGSAEEESDHVLAHARDNLILARELAKDKDFGSSALALTHAAEALADYSDDAPDDAAADAAKALQAHVNQMRSEIENNPPQLLQSSEHTIGQWVEAAGNLPPVEED